MTADRVELSFVYPIFNRGELFRHTLDSFILQNGRTTVPYEVLVVDDGSTEDILSVVKRYAEGMPASLRLPIRYLRIDVDRLPIAVAHSPDGGNNSNAAINVGLNAARGDRVVLTSPEVKHMTPYNLLLLATWQLADGAALVGDVYDETWANTEFAGWIGGGPRERPLHFLVAYPRRLLIAMGGMDEQFMRGHAFDDDELCARWLRNGHTYEFSNGAIVAEHQPHSRSYLPKGLVSNEPILRANAEDGLLVANTDHEWGDPSLIVDRWPV